MKNGRKWLGWGLTGLLAVIFLLNSLSKIFAASAIMEMMNGLGVGEWALIIGIGELTSTILFILPQTNKLGVILLSTLMGGAIAVHMSHSQMFFPQVIMLCLIWLTGAIRSPEMMRLSGHSQMSSTK